MKKNIGMKATAITAAMVMSAVFGMTSFAADGPNERAKEINMVTELSEAGITECYEDEEMYVTEGTFTETEAAKEEKAAAEAETAEQTRNTAAGTHLSSYTQDDLEVLAHVIAGEAGWCSDEEQRYVASVVLNRVGVFANTIRGVVFQKGQYACTWDGGYYQTPNSSNYANARYILENGSILPKNVVFQARFKQGSGTYIKTKYHYYCYA